MTKADKQLLEEVIADCISYNYSLAEQALRAGDSDARTFYKGKQQRAEAALSIAQESL